MKQYYLYIVECSDGLLYTGMTNNLNLRLEQHNAGTNKRAFTYKRRPVQLIFHEVFNDVEQLIYFEKKIKKWSAKKKRALASGDDMMLKILSECRNMTHHQYQPTKQETEEALRNLGTD